MLVIALKGDDVQTSLIKNKSSITVSPLSNMLIWTYIMHNWRICGLTNKHIIAKHLIVNIFS